MTPMQARVLQVLRLKTQGWTIDELLDVIDLNRPDHLMTKEALASYIYQLRRQGIVIETVTLYRLAPRRR